MAHTPVIGAEGSKRDGLAAPDELEEEPLPLPVEEGSIASGLDLPVMQVLVPLMMPEL